MVWIMLACLFLGQSPASVAKTETPGNYLIGSADSPVRFEIFSDFQCPYCRTFFLDTVSRLIKDYSEGNRVAIVFREFPLEGHLISREAARYAVAAQPLGRELWVRVVDYLYFCQAEWSYDGKIEPVLARILPPEDLQKVSVRLKDPATEQEIEKELALGNEKKVNSTPTVFVTIDGKEQRLSGVLTYSMLKEIIDRAQKNPL